MNLKNLNIGIANLVENNGRLELELFDSDEEKKRNWKWYNEEQEKNKELTKQLKETQKDFAEAIKLNGDKKIKDLISYFEGIKKVSDSGAILIDDVLKKINTYAKKDA